MRLAAALDGEIVSADSVQVFTGLDVGSSKLPESERAGIPHHMLDLLDPSLELGAGEFCDRAWAVMEDIVAQGKTPSTSAARCTSVGSSRANPPRPVRPRRRRRAARAAIAAAVADAEIEARATAAVSGADPEIAARAAGWRAATPTVADAGDAAIGAGKSPRTIGTGSSARWRSSPSRVRASRGSWTPSHPPRSISAA